MNEEMGQVKNFNARKDQILSGGYGVSEKALKLQNLPLFSNPTLIQESCQGCFK